MYYGNDNYSDSHTGNVNNDSDDNDEEEEEEECFIAVSIHDCVRSLPYQQKNEIKMKIFLYCCIQKWKILHT